VLSLFATQCDIAGTLLYEAVGRSLDAGAIGGHEQDFGQWTYRRQPTRSDVARLGATVNRLLGFRGEDAGCRPSRWP
jgi:hypothetical protein